MQILRCFFFSVLCITLSEGTLTAIQVATPIITEIPAGGIVIDTPGTYVFGNTIIWNPSGDGQAISITANNVTLDLQGYTLMSEVTQFKTIGILATAVENVTIKNGTVCQMGYQGVTCNQCANIEIKEITVNGLNMNNIATYTVPVGILVYQSVNAAIKKCTVQNLNVKTGSLAAIQCTETILSKISQCTVNNLVNRDGACTGIGHLACEQAEVEGCTVNDLRSKFVNNLNTEGHTAIGIVPVLSANIQIKHCKISNIIGCCDDAHGISVFECLGAVVKSCTVTNVTDGMGPTHSGAKSTGIEIYASGVLVSKCTVKNITAINPQDKQAAGFSCAQCIGVKFTWCTAENVNVFNEKGEYTSSLGYGVGFGWAPDPRPEFIFPAVDTLYSNCIAKKCQVGFDAWYHINSLWENLYSDCNGIAILNKNQPPRTISCDPCSECGCLQAGCYPSPKTVTITNVAKNNTFYNVKVKKCK